MIEEIIKKLKSIALIEAIISPEWEDRYFSYDSKWGEGEEMASMKNGCGDEWFLWVKDNQAALKSLSHEYGVLNDIEVIKRKFPEEYSSFISEPAFSINESSSLWYLVENQWVKFDINEDETKNLTEVFNWSPLRYKEWAEEYYENTFPIKAIENIMSGKVTDIDVKLLNKDVSFKDIEDELSEIGYSR